MKSYFLGITVGLVILGSAIVYGLFRNHESNVYLRGYDAGFTWGERAVRGEASRLGLGHWQFNDHGEPEFIFKGEVP